MLDSSWPGWTLLQSGIAASAGLGGVLIGSWMTARNQRIERRNAYITRQLQEFYSPMLSMRTDMAAKTETSRKINAIADRTFKEAKPSDSVNDRGKSYTHEQIVAVRDLRKYDYSQWESNIFPLYEKMLNHFMDHMWLAEPSTAKHYNDLVNYIEIWKRLSGLALTAEVVVELDTSDEKLEPLYADLRFHFDRLQKLIRK